MNQDEYLDQLLETRSYGRNQPLVENDEITACLTTAERLTQLQKIDVPAALTQRLEVSLRARIRSHRLFQPNSQAFSNEHVLPITHRRDSANTHRAPRHRAWVAMLGAAALLVLAFTGFLSLYAHTLPGGLIPGRKHTTPQVTATNNPRSQVSADIVLLRSALADLRTAVQNQRDDVAIQQALKVVSTRTTDCRNAVAAVPAGSEHDAAQQDLNVVLTEEEQTVRQLLLTPLDWSMRLRFTRQLGALGDPVPTITHVAVLPPSNGTILITLTGTHFDTKARLMLNGRPMGAVSLVKMDQLVASIPSSQGLLDTHAVGVLNPDGTAAQFFQNGGDDHSGSGTATPYPDH